MSNKRYDQFPAGTYDASKIILIADPITGELTKIPLSDFPTGAKFKRLRNILSALTTPGTSSYTALSYSVPANTLVTDGDSLTYCFSGLVTANPSASIATWFGSSGVQFSMSSSGGASWNFWGRIQRISGNTGRMTCSMIQDGSSFTKSFNGLGTLASLDFTNPITFELTMQCNISGSMTVNNGYLNQEQQ